MLIEFIIRLLFNVSALLATSRGVGLTASTLTKFDLPGSGAAWLV